MLDEPDLAHGRPRRPLFVMHNGGMGGSNQVVLNLVRRRPQVAVEAACAVLEDGPIVSVFERLGVSVAVVPSGRLRQVWRLPGVVHGLRRVIREHDSDLVFAHVPKAHVYASLAARFERVPYLWEQHDPPQVRPVGKWLVAKLPAAAVVCPSEFTAAYQRSLGARTPVVRIYPGPDLNGIPGPRAHTKRTGAVVGSVARLQRYKRHDLLLRAAPHVLDAEPSTRFQVIGGATPGLDPEYGEELVELAGALGIEDAVEFTGHVEDVPARLRTIDVLSHTAETDPFPLAVVEAMAHGVPVVCAPSGGPAEAVRDGVDGLHVDVEDAYALAEAILSLVRDPTLRERLGRAGHERASREFSAARMAAESWALMRKVALGLTVG